MNKQNQNQLYPKMYTLTTQPYLDKCNPYYKNIVTINLIPEGPLRYFVRRIHFPPLSTFQQYSEYKQCGYALASVSHGYNNTNNRLMTPNEIPDLFSFLTANNYIIDTSITKMMNGSNIKLTNSNILCFIKYLGNV